MRSTWSYLLHVHVRVSDSVSPKMSTLLIYVTRGTFVRVHVHVHVMYYVECIFLSPAPTDHEACKAVSYNVNELHVQTCNVNVIRPCMYVVIYMAGTYELIPSVQRDSGRTDELNY